MNQIKHIFLSNIKIFVFLFLAILLGIGFLSYKNINKQKQGYLGDLQGIINKRQLVVAVPHFENSKLFFHNKKGELQGYYVDVAKKIAKQLGVAVKFNESATSFDGVVSLIAQKKADVAICHLTKTTERAKKILYTNTNVILHQTLLVNRSWLEGNDAADLKDDDAIKAIQKHKIKIGTVKGSNAYVGFAKEIFPIAVVKEYPMEQLFSALTKGEIDALFYDGFYVKELMQNTNNKDLKLKTIAFKSRYDLIAMAVPAGHWDMLYWLNLYSETNNNIKMSADELLKRVYSNQESSAKTPPKI